MTDYVLADELHRVLLDEYALERRCVPSDAVLSKVFTEFCQDKNETIDVFSPDKCCGIFEQIVRMSKRKSTMPLPDKKELKAITDTFKDVAFLNNREQALLDKDDLRVLCILHNIIYSKKSPSAYLEIFKNWES
jgi:hypothetical protein